MAKRKSYGGDGGYSGKKQKTAHVHDPPTSEDVYTGRQLRELLAFEQDLRKARHGMLVRIQLRPFLVPHNANIIWS